jgi:hypothetical protein
LDSKDTNISSLEFSSEFYGDQVDVDSIVKINFLSSNENKYFTSDAIKESYESLIIKKMHG